MVIIFHKLSISRNDIILFSSNTPLANFMSPKFHNSCNTVRQFGFECLGDFFLSSQSLTSFLLLIGMIFFVSILLFAHIFHPSHLSASFIFYYMMILWSEFFQLLLLELNSSFLDDQAYGEH
jgi:hypothetical protein